MFGRKWWVYVTKMLSVAWKILQTCAYTSTKTLMLAQLRYCRLIMSEIYTFVKCTVLNNFLGGYIEVLWYKYIVLLISLIGFLRLNIGEFYLYATSYCTIIRIRNNKLLEENFQGIVQKIVQYARQKKNNPIRKKWHV